MITKQLNFPELRQTYEWDCGAKALQSVLTYYGIEVREELIIKYAKTNSKEGTSILKMKYVLEKYKLKVEAKKMTVTDLKNYIDGEIPIIILLQAWNNKNFDYTNDNSNGHWVVAIGYNTNNIIFEDPYSFKRTYLKIKELENRWHAKENRKIIYNYGIAVIGKKGKYNLANIIHMD